MNKLNILLVAAVTMMVGRAHAEQMPAAKTSALSKRPMMNVAKVDRATVEKNIAQWPTSSATATRKIMDKYGAPSEITSSMIIWHNNSPWKKTIVYKEEVEHMFPKKHKDILQQYTQLKVPTDKMDEISQFDGSLLVDRTKGEVIARGETEEANFLAVNLAKDIVDGRRTVQEARNEYAKLSDMSLTSKTSRDYTKSFIFSTSGVAADPDFESSATGGAMKPTETPMTEQDNPEAKEKSKERSY